MYLPGSRCLPIFQMRVYLSSLSVREEEEEEEDGADWGLAAAVGVETLHQ